jgi:N-acetylneuraminate synthase/N,N'-diacetyllegionaminate synthase
VEALERTISLGERTGGGERTVGDGCPTLIVAEIGVNHDGDVETALRMIEEAARAGADAVKVQVFRAADVVAADAATATDQRNRTGDVRQREMLARLELSTEQFARLRRCCADRHLLFLATPFSEPDVRRVMELHPAAIKIASTDLTNPPLLDAAAGTGLPLILSTGASLASEIRDAVCFLRERGTGERLVLLHCVSRYPTPEDALNLRAMETLRRWFEVPVGLSDHSVSTETGAWAVAVGACVLEKHFTLDAHRSGPDHALSLTPAAFRQYVRGVRRVEQALGIGRIGLSEQEREVRRVAGKSLVAASFLPAGTVLNESMLTIKRPGAGVPPSERDRLIGHRVRRDVSADTVLTWDMLETGD